MIKYEFETKETCRIACSVEGHHVAAALDSLLSARRAGNVLTVPHLIEDLIILIATMKPLAIIRAAANGGCMPGMVLEALMSIKSRALFWHKKAVRHDAAELRRQEELDARRRKEQKREEGRAHGDVDQVTEGRPADPPPKATRPRGKRPGRPKTG